MYQFKSYQLKNTPDQSAHFQPVQTKLKIGQPGDKYEHEADAVAEKVMQQGNTDTLRMQPLEEEEELMQMQPMNEEEEELQMKSEESIQKFMFQKQSEEEEEPVQAKPLNSSQPVTPTDHIYSRINSSRDSGSSMDKNTMSFMQNRFGTNFGDVKIHTGNTAVQLNEQFNAQAFTVGNDIFFNNGKYNPVSFSGKRLLAHELTHTIQQGGGIHPMIQKDGEEGATGSSTPLADLISGIVREQLTNSSMQNYLRSLGNALQGLAVESTAGQGDQPALSTERLAALGISGAFETTSGAILRDPGFAALRRRLIDIIGSSDEVALIAALAAGIAAVLADVPLRGSPSRELGAGFSVGGSFDFGSIQSLRFNNMQIYAQYARDYFSTRLTGSVSRSADTGEFTGSGTGEVRLGNDIGHLLGRITINSEGEVVVVGRFSGGYQFGGSDQLVFTTDLTHSFATGETIVQPGISGRFSLGSDQSIRLGSSLSISTDSGLTGVTGFIEYNADFLRFRVEGSMTGIPGERSMAPGSDMRIQGLLTIPLF